MFDGTYSLPKVGVRNRPDRKKGQGLVEYALILALVATVVMVILIMVGPAISQTFMDVKCTLQWRITARSFTRASSSVVDASGVWNTSDYKFLWDEYRTGVTTWCGLQNRPNARPAFPSAGYTEPVD